jgi:hypothetical protein
MSPFTVFAVPSLALSSILLCGGHMGRLIDGRGIVVAFAASRGRRDDHDQAQAHKSNHRILHSL